MGEIRDPCEQPVCLYRSTISSHQRHIRRGPGLLLGEWSGSLWRRQAPEVRGAASHSAVLPPPRKNHSDLQRAHKAVRAPLFCLAKSYRFSRCKHRGWRRRGALLGFGARQGKLNRPIRRMKAWWGELRPSGPPTFDAATAAQPSGQSKKGHTLRRERRDEVAQMPVPHGFLSDRFRACSVHRVSVAWMMLGVRWAVLGN